MHALCTHSQKSGVDIVAMASDVAEGRPACSFAFTEAQRRGLQQFLALVIATVSEGDCEGR